MSKTITLSYVLTTYNKLPYLKVLIGDLLSNCGPDEEIVVVDGASSDGSAEFLGKLYEEGKIHIYVSEKDLGEAHGFNKGTLLARGELIKYVSDDDIYFYDKIKELRDFMLAHPEVDLMGTNGWAMHMKDVTREGVLAKEDNSPFYNGCMIEYLTNGKPFPFTGLGLMVRRKSVPGIGLFATNSIAVDFELGLRATSHPKLSIGWWDSTCYVQLKNADSNSVKYLEMMNLETHRLEEYYRARKIKPLKSGSWAAVRMRIKHLLVEIYWMIRKRDNNKLSDQELSTRLSRNNLVQGDDLSIEEKISLVTEYSASLRKNNGEFRWKRRA